MSTELNKTLVVVGTGSIVMTTLYLYNSLALSGIAFVFWMFLVFIVEFLWVDTQSNEKKDKELSVDEYWEKHHPKSNNTPSSTKTKEAK